MRTFMTPALALLAVLGPTGCSSTPESAEAAMTKSTVAEELAACRELEAAYDVTFDDTASTVGREVTANEIADLRLNVARKIADEVGAKLSDTEAQASSFLIRRGRLVLVVENKILFEKGQSKLGPGATDALDKLAEALAALPKRDFLVAGHTDARPVSAKNVPFASNRALSLHRATVVADALAARGIPETRMSRVGWGEHRPLDPAATVAAYAHNRRIEIVFRLQEDEIPSIYPSDSPLVKATPATQEVTQ